MVWVRCWFEAKAMRFFMRYRGGGGLCKGIRKDLHWYKGKTVNFEAFDLADVKIIGNCQLNKLYFIQYYRYTESNMNAENPDLIINTTYVYTY
jgi:hypothetical protein